MLIPPPQPSYRTSPDACGTIRLRAFIIWGWAQAQLISFGTITLSHQLLGFGCHIISYISPPVT
jgi:hypothetical protein